MKPLISIVIEAYNEENNALAPPADTLNALRKQGFPLEQVELVLLGSPQQIECWDGLNVADGGFGRVRLVPVSPTECHYWQLKNKGAEAAEGEFLAFIDCDALPGPRWLPALAEALLSGADVSVGVSQYRTERLDCNSSLMLAAALPSWAFQLARSETPKASALMAHNLAIRRDLLLQHPFRILKRSFASSLLYFELVRCGAKFSFQPEQKVAHGMTFRWWLSRMHFRRGWETYLGRNCDPDWPRSPRLEKMKFIEPIVLRMGLVFRDARHWFRYSRVIGVGRFRALYLFPLVVTASFAARSAEMAGMYAALLAPEASEHQARF